MTLSDVPEIPQIGVKWCFLYHGVLNLSDNGFEIDLKLPTSDRSIDSHVTNSAWCNESYDIEVQILALHIFYQNNPSGLV